MFVAAITRVLDIAAWVAGLAGLRALLAMVKREAVAAQLGRRPGLGGVAIMAVLSKKTSVDFGLGVALRALAWCSPKDALHMAVLAGDLCVRSIQGEETGVSEVAHAVQAVVTIHTGRSEVFQVLLDEGWAIGLSVAVLAGGLDSLIDSAEMAVAAGQGLSVGFLEMVDQAEADFSFVIKRFSLPLRRLPGLRVVAGCAIARKQALVG